MKNQITGRSAFLALLKDEGVSQLFGNPGTTELPIMDALKDHPDMDYILGLQESVVVAMADGYSRATGKLVSCNVHVAPGLGNAMGALYNAKFTGTPLIITAGQQEIGHGLTEPLLYDPLVPIAEPLVKWAVEVHRLEDLPRIVRRAAKVATTPPMGPVFISLPGDILNDEAGIDLGQSTRVDTASRPSDASLSALAGRLLAAKYPAIIAGHEIVTSDAMAEAAQFAETLGAPVYQQTVPYGSHFLSEHPAYMGGLTRSQKQVRDTLQDYDLLVVLGADVLRMSVYSEIDPLPADMPVVQIGQNDWEMGKNYASETALRGDVKVTLAALSPMLAEQGGAAQQATAESRIAALQDGNWTAQRDAKRIATQAKQDAAAADAPIDGDWLMMQMVDAMPDNAVLVNEGLTTAGSLLSFYPYRERYDFHGLPSGGIGWGIAAAVGVSLADRERPTVAVIGDGSAMYSIQALWTAANMKLPLTYVICNNKGYRIIKQRLKAFHGNEHYVGMDFLDPELDFVKLAQGFGMAAQRITDAADVRPALDAAIASGKPNLLDVIVDRTV